MEGDLWAWKTGSMDTDEIWGLVSEIGYGAEFVVDVVQDSDRTNDMVFLRCSGPSVRTSHARKVFSRVQRGNRR